MPWPWASIIWRPPALTVPPSFNWDGTPGYINIPVILWLLNLALGWDLVEFGCSRYRQLGHDMPWVRGNNAAAVRQFDLGIVAEKAGLQTEELVRRLQAAHHLFTEEAAG